MNIFLFALIAVLMAMAGCASSMLQGKVSNDSYVAPAEIFSCPIPYSKLAHPIQIQDSADKEKGVVMAGSLRFLGFAGVYRIDYMADTNSSPRESINRILDIQLEWYRQIPSPKAYVLHQEFDGERLFAVLVAPEGQLDISDSYGKHPDLSRSMLIFKHGYYIYAVSADANDSLEAKSSDNSPERFKRLRKQIDEFAETIKFPPETTK
jgi:hypothetical protein